jgi:hypothetical protein
MLFVLDKSVAKKRQNKVSNNSIKKAKGFLKIKGETEKNGSNS